MAKKVFKDNKNTLIVNVFKDHTGKWVIEIGTLGSSGKVTGNMTADICICSDFVPKVVVNGRGVL